MMVLERVVERMMRVMLYMMRVILRVMRMILRVMLHMMNGINELGSIIGLNFLHSLNLSMLREFIELNHREKLQFRCIGPF